MDRPPHLDIDLNEAPSPPPYDNPPEDAPSPPRSPAPAVHAPPPPQLPPPVPPLPAALASSSQQLGGQKEALEVACRFHPLPEWSAAPFAAMGNMPAGLLPGLGLPLPPPAPFPGEAGWGHPPRPCASCGHPETLGGTVVCDSCDRGFHPACVRVWPPLRFTPAPSSGPPGARRPRAVANEDWICPECEMRGARSTLWKLGPVPLDINAAPPEEPVAVAVRDTSRTNATDGVQLNEVAKQLPHPEGIHLKNTAIFDGIQFMPTFDLAHRLGMRQQFTSVDQDITADGNISQRANHLCRKRDLPQTSALPMFTENHEFGSSSIFMDPSFFNKAKEQSPNENRSSTKPPKFLLESSKRPRHHTVGLPVQYGDFFITNLGEIDNRASYHNSYQIWPVGFTSYWHDRVTGSLFECEVSDGGNFGPLFTVRRLPCSSFPLPEASTILCPNVVRKADTIETKESSSLIEDTATDTDDNILMLISDPSESNQDIVLCLNDMEGKRTAECSSVPSSNVAVPSIQSQCGISSQAPTKEGILHDKIGEYTFEGTSPSSVWRMISCAMMEACEKMYKEHGHLTFFCTHGSEKPSSDHGSGSQNTDDPCNPLNRFCSSYGPNIPRFIEKDSDVESAFALLKEWLYQDRIGFDLEFVQEIVESLPKSRACSTYQFLCDRDGSVSSLTVASGTLVAVHKNSLNNGDVMSYGRHGSVVLGPQDLAQPSSFDVRDLPPGNPISRKLPPELAGDVFQILEFLGRFAEIIGLKEVPSIEQVENELIDPWPICANQKDIQQHRDHTPTNSPANASVSYSNTESVLTTNEEMASVFIPVETFSTEEAAQDMVSAQTIGRCSGVVLPEIHLALLRVLFSELLSKVAIFVDPKIDLKESKSKRGKKRDADNIMKELKVDMLTANKLTWPELARRYIIAVSSMNGSVDFSDVSSREGVKLFRCLQGDGGILCGAVPGVVGMEKDALLLAEAENLIYNSSANEGNKIFMMDYKDNDVISSPGEPTSDMKTLPGWVESLEPVRKLPTNVGTRIRKCVYEALERNPPEWARKILEHSISKEVYKGNASGPTKKAVLNVLAEACRVKVPQNPEKPRKEKNIISISEAILKKCRIALRRAISSDESKLFGNLLGTTLTNSNENEDDGILGFPGMVSRPLDFRTIDIRLAMGVYRGSWEAFLDDVQEVIRNLHTAFGDRPDMLEMVVRLSQNFETLYKTEVLDLVQKFDKYLCNENASSEISEPLLDILTAANSMLKAPWEVGVCKVCGIDRDDDNVLLCDKCDSEYHTYCLNPPLPRVPRGNWYCPSCASGEKRAQPDHTIPDLMQEQKQHVVESPSFCESLNKLATAMEDKEYWELSVPERIHLLKFLCDEMLSTALVREHLDQCLDKSGDLQQKYRSWNYELKELKYKAELRTSCARQNKWTTTDHLSNSSGLVENQQRGISSVSGNLEDVDHLSNSSGLVENQQRGISSVSGNLEDVRVNIGVNLNHPADGASAGDLNADRSSKADNDISSSSVNEGNKSLGLPKQPTGLNTDRIDEGAVGEASQSCEKSLGCTIISAPNEEPPEKNAGTLQDSLEASTTRVVDQDVDNNEMNILLDRISQLQESIKTVESQLTMASLRRECLGRDSIGRLYWVIMRPGKRPSLVADGSMLIPKDRDTSMVSSYPQSTFECRAWNSASIVMYESDDEIKYLVEWLRDFDPRERELRDSILLWQRILYLQASCPNSDPPVCKFSKNEPPIDLPNMKASLILEQKYGPLLDQDTSELSKRRGKKVKSGSEERTYRCDCFEPILPSRYHCSTCHETYLTSTEYEEHNGGKCNGSNNSSNESKENEEPKVKGTKSDTKEKDTIDNNCCTEPTGNKKLESCPYDFEEICRKFITNDSNKEIVKEIGLIGSNGAPSFVPSPAFFLEPPGLLSQGKRYDDIPKDWTSSLEECQAMSEKTEQEGSKSGLDCPGNSGDEQGAKSRKPVSNNTSVEDTSSATDKPMRLLAVNGGLIPESSLRPVIGRNSHILKQLKINLLDVEAALPEEALKSSKSQQIRRRSWRAFVKDAESISQVVLATNLLEGMIKAEFLKNDWWYWSSFTAAVKTPTISSLALRIYTLDDCIIYMKDHTEPADNAKPGNRPKRRKETESSVS